MNGAHRFGPWTAYCDLLLCVLVVIITMVATKKVDADAGRKDKAEYILTAEWSVDVDADVDLWLIQPPGDQPLFYQSREVGCAHLDRDSRGFLDNIVHLPDGRVVKSLTAKETVALRCIVPGRYDIGVHLYDMRIDGASITGAHESFGLKVRIEVIKVNPNYQTVFTQEITLDRPWQTVNAISFDLAEDGRATAAEPPLEPVTAKYYRNRNHL